ncbi:MAG: hypothetical protein ACSI46_23515 [Gloeotrichia echinulata DVL01]
MKQYMVFTKHFLVFATSLVASSVLVASPGRAATFAFSEGNFEFKNFSQSPVDTFAEAIINTPSTSGVQDTNNVTTLANANASFIDNSGKASNSSFGVAIGANKDYLGIAENQSTVQGIFDVEKDTLFSFDFTGDLTLKTSIDNPTVENANATGDVSFALIDTADNSILDYFTLGGNLTKNANQDFLSFETNGNVSLSNLFTKTDFDGNQKSAQGSFDGSVKRYFTEKTRLALTEINQNQVSVSVSEPSLLLPSLFCCGVIGVALKRKRKKPHHQGNNYGIG